MKANPIGPQVIAEAGQYVQLQFKVATICGNQFPTNWTGVVAGIPASSMPGMPGPCHVSDMWIRLVDQMKNAICAQQNNSLNQITDFVFLRFAWDIQLGEMYMALQFNPGGRYAVGQLMYKVG